MTTTAAEILDLAAKGWTPPPEELEPYRHLIEPFNKARGFKTFEQLDEHDCKNLTALLATFDHFGIPVPPQMPSEKIADELPWVTVLRAYVAEHDGFTTEDALDAVGWLPSRQNIDELTQQLTAMNLSWTNMLSRDTLCWTKRQAA